jgi:hypothetical protein
MMRASLESVNINYHAGRDADVQARAERKTGAPSDTQSRFASLILFSSLDPR